MSERLFLSLGSNRGKRRDYISFARDALLIHPQFANLSMSAFYETDPLYNTDQPVFLNTVIRLDTALSPEGILKIMQELEQLAGRPDQREKNQPRTLDIDILALGQRVVKNTALSIPHPDLINRKFVLVPWNEIAPDYIVPYWNRSVSDLLSTCPDQSTVRLLKERIEA